MEKILFKSVRFSFRTIMSLLIATILLGVSPVAAGAGGTGDTGKNDTPGDSILSTMSQAQIQDLAERYSPIWFIAKSDPYPPMPVEDYVENSCIKDRTRDDELLRFPIGEVDLSLLSRYSYRSVPSISVKRAFELQYNCDQHWEDFPSINWRTETSVFANVSPRDGGGFSIQYWVFYGYNPPSHDADWESVTISFSRKGNPRQIAYSAHGHLSVGNWWETNKEGTNTQVLVANGGHGNSPVSNTADSSYTQWRRAKIEVMTDNQGDILQDYRWIAYKGEWGTKGIITSPAHQREQWNWPDPPDESGILRFSNN